MRLAAIIFGKRKINKCRNAVLYLYITFRQHFETRYYNQIYYIKYILVYRSKIKLEIQGPMIYNDILHLKVFQLIKVSAIRLA